MDEEDQVNSKRKDREIKMNSQLADLKEMIEGTNHKMNKE